MIEDELIARLEAAPEGSRELDIEIARALGWTCLAEHQDNDACRFAVLNAQETGDWSGINWDDETGKPRGDCRQWPFTTSLDAAVTLVPKGWWAEIFVRPDQPSCILWEFSKPCRRIPPDWPYVIAAKTAPTALSMAALKARRP